MLSDITRYQIYSEYRKITLGWLNNLPSHWEVKKLKYLGDSIIGLTYSPDDVVQFESEGVLVLRSSNVQNKLLAFEDNVYVKKEIPEKLKTKLGDILICARNGSRALIGKNAEIDESAVGLTFGAFMMVFRSQYNSYLSYVFNSAIFEYQSGTFLTATINQLTSSNLNSFEVPLPPKAEQAQIANFLDHETAQIDTLINKQQTLIQLLKEKRQAVISHAVTKGLNPDAPMKDSGVEWLGDVPEHWEYLKFDYVVNSVGDIDHYMPKSVDSGVPYLMTGDLKDLVSDIDFDRCKQVDNKSYIQLSRKTKTMKGNLILARYATIGTVSYVDIEKEFLVSYACVTIDPNTEIVLGKYLYWYLKSQAFADAIKRYINSNTQGNVGVDSLKRVKLVVPTLKEQESIITYIEDMTSRFDTLNKKAEQAIQLMQERRTALISAAVTGKIDVRGWSK